MSRKDFIAGYRAGKKAMRKRAQAYEYKIEPTPDGYYKLTTFPDGEYADGWEYYDSEAEAEQAAADMAADLGVTELRRRAAGRKTTRRRAASMRRKASDGWDEEICSELILALEACSALEYEVKNARRGYYVLAAGDTYETLGDCAYKFGERLMEVGEQLADEYGHLTSEEIDDM